MVYIFTRLWRLSLVGLMALIGFLLMKPNTAVEAAPFVLRYVQQPPSALSTASRFPVQVEIFDQGTGTRANISGTTITLRLMQLVADVPTTVNVNFASAVTANGLATFNNVNLSMTGNTYYFSAQASGYSSVTSNTFNVSPSTLAFSFIPFNLSTASSINFTVSVRRGAAQVDPIDTLANNINIRLKLHDGTSDINENFLNAPTVNGVATFSNVNISTALEIAYLYAYAPSFPAVDGRFGPQFHVEPSTLAFSFIPFNLSTASSIDFTVSVRRGSAQVDPIDPLADNVVIRLKLHDGTSNINENFLNATTVDGVATFSNVNISTALEIAYLYAYAPDFPAVNGRFGPQFSVEPSTVSFGFVPFDMTTATSFNLTVSVRRGTSPVDPIDPLADNVNIRLRLYNGTTFLNDNFANALTTDGVATFSNLNINIPVETGYLYAFSTNFSAVNGRFSPQFTVTPASIFHLLFTLQGRPAPPNAALAVPVSIILTPTSGGTPITNSQTANIFGQATLNGLTPGSYTVWIKYERALAIHQQNIVLNPGLNTLNIGQMPGGDADDSNAVNLVDFSLLAASFGKSNGQQGYDARSDFNDDGTTNLIDFSLLASNFGTTGAAP